MKQLVIISSFFISVNVNGQVPVEDAAKLKELLNTATSKFDISNKNAVNAILKNYTSGSIKVVQQNPFLKDFCVDLIPLTQAATDAGAVNIISTTDVQARSISTGSVIIDGLARFIVTRIKKELQAAFFERLHTFIRKEEYRDCRTLFPNTYKTLLSVEDQIYNYEVYLTALRNAFGKDLELIIPNLESVIRNGKYATFFSQHAELKSICLTALYITKEIKNGEHIGVILEKYPSSDPDYLPAGSNQENIGVIHAIQFVQELSKSFKSSTAAAGRYWVDNSVLNELRDINTLKLYLGLLYQRVKDITYGNGADETFGKLLEKANQKFEQIKQLVNITTENIKECEQKLSELRSNQSFETIVNYVNSISGLLNGIRNAQPFIDLSSLAVGPLSVSSQTTIDKVWELLDKANFIIDNAMNIYTHLKERKYMAVVGDVRNIYKHRFDVDNINVGSNKEKKYINEIFDFLVYYGSALGEIVEAKDSKEVYEVIDRVAAPVGSSKVKKDNVFSISLNAYGGVFVGKEKIENVNDDSKANNYGISAPVGLAFSLGKIKTNNNSTTKGNKSITLFISIIDIGAPVSFRFQNDTLNEIPTVEWKDIIAPGASLIYGFGKVPISLAVGWQTGPNLRKVTSQYNDYSNSKYSRFMLGLYVDIPVFIFARRKYW